jgi:uncharacterized protein YggE
MKRKLIGCALLVALAIQSHSIAIAQMGGSRAGVGNFAQGTAGASEGPQMLTREVAESYISVEGRAEVRVKPTQIRIVLAVTSTGKTAQECQAAVKAQIEKLKGGWQKLNIGSDKIVEDFIAVLPTFAWNVEKRGEINANVETHTGFRMQTNIHLSVANDEAANAALNAAFEQGITDIIAFDYWSPEIDAAKGRAREEAIKAAKGKAYVLLAIFESQPPVINVQEETVVRKPESLYESFANAVEGEVNNGWRDHNLPTFHAPRPKNTYFKGLQSTGDIQGSALPMRMEISVVSSVRIYYESPAAPKRQKDEAKK